MAGSGNNRRVLAIVGVVAVVGLGVVAQVAMSVVELWEGLTSVEASGASPDGSSVGSASDGPVARPKAASARSLQAGAPDEPPAPAAKTPSAVPLGTIVHKAIADAGPAAVDSDRLRELEARRAARERWREAQSPEEIEARRQRQQARRQEMTPEAAAIRDQQRAYKRSLFGDTD